MGLAPDLFIHTTRWGKVRIFSAGLQFFGHMIVYKIKQQESCRRFVVNLLFRIKNS